MVAPHLDFRVLRHIPIAAVLAARGIPLVRRGPRLVGCCPVHGGDNPRAFVAHTERNLWHCFTRCGGGGDVIDLVRRMDRTGHAAAARYLASLAPGMPEPVPLPRPRPPAEPPRPYTRTLPLDPHHDLLRGKGIRPETARRFEVGGYCGRGFLQGCVGVACTTRTADRSATPGAGSIPRRCSSSDGDPAGQQAAPGSPGR